MTAIQSKPVPPQTGFQYTSTMLPYSPLFVFCYSMIHIIIILTFSKSRLWHKHLLGDPLFTNLLVYCHSPPLAMVLHRVVQQVRFIRVAKMPLVVFLPHQSFCGI